MTRPGRTGSPARPNVRRGARLATAIAAIGLLASPALPAVARPGAAIRPDVRIAAAITNGSNPNYLVSHNGFVWFVAQDPTGNGIWKSDGATTTDVYPGIDAAYLTWAGNNLFFEADDATHGQELWVADGVNPPTVIDATNGTDGSDPQNIVPVGNKVFYEACDPARGCEPWVSDGSPGGTHILKDIVPGPNGSDPSWITAFGTGGDVGFVATDLAHSEELWWSDGTPGGTKLLKDVDPGSQGSYPSGLVAFNGHMFFIADDGSHGEEPWVTDGTRASTRLLKDIAHGTSDSVDAYSDFYYDRTVIYKNRLFFTANDGTHNGELWRTDGTPSGTQLAVDVFKGSHGSWPYGLLAGAGLLFFGARDGSHGYELWASDGSKSGTGLAKDIRQGAMGSDPLELGISLGTSIVLTANDGVHGVELWGSKGSPGSTKLLADISPGDGSSDIAHLTVLGANVFFSADDGTHGNELWMTDGSPGGTLMVMDIYP